MLALPRVRRRCCRRAVREPRACARRRPGSDRRSHAHRGREPRPGLVQGRRMGVLATTADLPARQLHGGAADGAVHDDPAAACRDHLRNSGLGVAGILPEHLRALGPRTLQALPDLPVVWIDARLQPPPTAGLRPPVLRRLLSQGILVQRPIPRQAGRAVTPLDSTQCGRVQRGPRIKPEDRPVLVAGQAVVSDGQTTAARPGKVLRRS